MDDKLTISDFGVEQSRQFEAMHGIAPERFLEEAKTIYQRSLAPVAKGIEFSQFDALFDLKESQRPFASFSIPARIQEQYHLLTPAQPMQSIRTAAKLEQALDRLGEQEPELKAAFRETLGYVKNAQQIRNQIIGIGKA